MRVQCDGCERATASIICCADEAALCEECDARIHAANKLASKHQRVPLITRVEIPRCDICQEKAGYFFCLEDRALLCRDCDVSIHVSTSLSSAHKRFLVPGTRVALEALSNSATSSQEGLPAEDISRDPLSSIINTAASILSKSPSVPQKQSMFVPAPPFTTPKQDSLTSSSKSDPVASSCTSHQSVSSTSSRRGSITEFLSDAIPNWRVDELLNIPDLGEGYSLGDIASSKADQVNLGDYDWTADLSLFDEQVYAESFHEVPQMFSPPRCRELCAEVEVVGL